MGTGHHQQTAEVLAADLFTAARLVLLTEDGSLEQRLVRAYGEFAVHATPLAGQLPAALSVRVTALHATLSGGGAGGDGTLAPADAVAALEPEARVRVAIDIADIAGALQDEVDALQAVVKSSD